MKRIIGFRNAGFNYRDAPPRYTEEDVNDRRYVEAEIETKRYTEAETNNKRAVEVAAPPPNPFFEPVERQRHFGILRYTVNNRFRKLMVLGICNAILIILVLLVIGFLVFKFGISKDSHASTTTTRQIPIRTALKQESSSTMLVASTVTTVESTTEIDTTTTPSTTEPVTTSTTTTTTTTTPKPIPTTTTKHTTATAAPILNDNCKPLDKTMFLFAYSNDFDSTTVLNALNYFSKNSTNHFEKFANVRFDTQTEEVFEIHDNWSDFNTSIRSNLPDPSQALFFMIASDLLQMLNRFMEKEEASICGARFFILVKRYPDEIDITELVTKLRLYHVEVTFVISTSSAGDPSFLYRIATETNGNCFFDSDYEIVNAIQASPSFYNPYLIYAVNPTVSGSGSLRLLTLYAAEADDDYWFSMTTQDNKPIDIVQSVVLQWSGYDQTIDQIGVTGGVSVGSQFSGNHVTAMKSLNREIYQIDLNYNYSDTIERKLQIRVHKGNTTLFDYWPSYTKKDFTL